MKRIFITALILLIALPAYAAKKKPVTRPLTEDQKAFYAVGLVLARQLEVFDLTPAELRIVKRGLNDAARGRKPKVDFAVYSKKSQDLAIARRDAHGKKLASRVAAFMAQEEAREGSVKTASGLIFQSVKEGDGAAPALTDKVKVHYKSTLIDGKEMANTYKIGQADASVLNEFMKCLSEGMQMMKQGGKARLICPPEISLGNEGTDNIPPGATLIFDLELLEVTK
ncbi:FKBP-type peptidyl-prolyl cis-trans isomerase [Geobacter pelophilus]|jgi:FKBP-type peptidyl-prolyl cis-trans isomerase FkpA|uniref:Peptidyl-prolyl cis-trans isomerase n=1 Tax=Geoanaerobacter pelophilus TaxID=60036 RepID=A0AAW4L5P1_9BACT|nr:FKBP-type peptidyl-prolyl cis-trans isomerase [Geoanaerobacter pelophilus]MBT0666544.1 FKBP-type peptidyl-prolyl cis-trans isomerase [Geoanaerobacter pelophilus]